MVNCARKHRPQIFSLLLLWRFVFSHRGSVWSVEWVVPSASREKIQVLNVKLAVLEINPQPSSHRVRRKQRAASVLCVFVCASVWICYCGRVGSIGCTRSYSTLSAAHRDSDSRPKAHTHVRSCAIEMACAMKSDENRRKWRMAHSETRWRRAYARTYVWQDDPLKM